MTIPTGFVKSTIHAPGADRRSTASARSRTTGTVRRAFAKPPDADGLLADQAEPRRQRLVAEPGPLAADPELDEDEVGAVDRRVAIGRPDDAPGPALAGEHPLGEAADDREPLGVDVEEGDLVDRHPVGAPGEPSTSSGV